MKKSKTQNRIFIENTIKKINNKLNVVLNREIDIYELSMNKIKSHIDVINVENWKTKLADSKKADTYKLFKNMPKFEKYFDYIKNVKHLTAFIKFRVSDHNLLIEEGRRKRPIIPRNERLCKTCNKIEDESHFLIDCDIYNYARGKEFKNIIVEFPRFAEITDSITRFIFLMSQENEKVTILVASCIYNWFEKKNERAF